ncbi:ABC transporter permease [Clostridium sp. BNL1100]|uniref:ABC transporter permease n=1 Tax=Clostridium sp. BNL1100 TaxID=755731 RepID=UPI00024A7BE5|nr:ABC transporter permease [Clostridium sp. BNL1100]AEY67050.1 hypothetical protein Clo1100_2898 [Clostridium sp. BNL1100]
MYETLSTEFLKLRRSKVLIYTLIAGILPSIVKFLQFIFESTDKVDSWQWFLASRQEIMIFGVLITVVLASSFIFNMEYQYGTASYIYTSRVPKIQIFLAKLLTIFAVVILLFAVTFASELLFGVIAIKTAVPGALLLKSIKVTVWYILSYGLLSNIVVLISVLTKRFVLTSVIIFGYMMLVFPFHLKNNIYISPFMTPAAVAARIFGSNNYILVNYFKDAAVNITAAAVFIIALAAVSLALGLIVYQKSDALL